MPINFNISNEDIIAFLKKSFAIKEIYNLILYQRIVEKTCQEKNIKITEEEIQIEVNKFRYANKLEKATDTLKWLEQQKVTSDDWEKSIIEKLLTQKLKDVLFSEEIILKYFAENQLNWQQIVLYQIIVTQEALAQEIFYQIEEAEISFYEAANKYDVDPIRRLKFGYEGIIYRRQLTPNILSVIFSVPQRETTPPLKTESGYHLFLVQDLLKPQITTEIKAEIQEQLFKQWISQEFNYLIYNQTTEN